MARKRIIGELLELGIKAATGERLEEPSDVDKEIDLFVRQQKEQKKLVLEKDFGVAVQFLKTGAYHLFERVDEKTKKLGDLFESRTLTLTGNVSSKGATWQDSLNAVVTRKVGTGPVPSVIHLNLALKGYIGQAPHPFSLDQAFSIHLGDYEYSVNFYGQAVTHGIYSDTISAEAADKIVSEFLKKLLVQIKNLSGK